MGLKAGQHPGPRRQIISLSAAIQVAPRDCLADAEEWPPATRGRPLRRPL